MLTQTLALLTVLTAAATVTALPTATTTFSSTPDKTTALTGVTHSVVAGRGGALLFDPENVVAEVGDVVEWHFLPKNHSVAQSSFGQPCVPDASLAKPFFSGFQPTQDPQAPNVFQIVVEDKTPIWYYCAQTTGNHCQNGMAGVINQNFDGPNTLAAHKALAAKTGTSVVPPVIQGGAVIPNPNPNAGF
jgi:plastocyanin